MMGAKQAPRYLFKTSIRRILAASQSNTIQYLASIATCSDQIYQTVLYNTSSVHDAAAKYNAQVPTSRSYQKLQPHGKQNDGQTSASVRDPWHATSHHPCRGTPPGPAW
jgi:hypothetical protein